MPQMQISKYALIIIRLRTLDVLSYSSILYAFFELMLILRFLAIQVITIINAVSSPLLMFFC